VKISHLKNRHYRSWIEVLGAILSLSVVVQVSQAAPVIRIENGFEVLSALEVGEAFLARVEIARAPLGEEARYARGGARLLDFFSKSVRPVLPAEAVSVLKGWSLIIRLDPQAPRDGYFVAPKDRRARELVLLMRPTLLFSEDAKQVVAHEFFHALHWVWHQDEEVWLREGLAQVFEGMVLGRFNGTNLVAALRRSTTPLVEFKQYQEDQANAEQYGHDLLYVHYLWMNCGEAELFWSIVQGEPGYFGAEGIDRALKRSSRAERAKPQCFGFEESAVSLEVARIHNRIVYEPKKGASRRYYLKGGAIERTEPRTQISYQELTSLPRHCPVHIASSVLLPARWESLGFRRFWLHSRFPYEVLEIRPATLDSTWTQVLLRAK
jgi:hypothetical protein